MFMQNRSASSLLHASVFAVGCACAALATQSALAGPREQAKRMHDRIAGVPPSESVLDAMEADIIAGRAEDAALQAARADSGHGRRAGRRGRPAYHDFVTNADGARAAHRRIDSEAAVRVPCHGAHHLDVCRELALLAGRHDATQRWDLAVQTCVRQVEVGVAPAVLGQLVARFGAARDFRRMMDGRLLTGSASFNLASARYLAGRGEGKPGINPFALGNRKIADGMHFPDTGNGIPGDRGRQ